MRIGALRVSISDSDKMHFGFDLSHAGLVSSWRRPQDPIIYSSERRVERVDVKVERLLRRRRCGKEINGG